jgi:phytol kinase
LGYWEPLAGLLRSLPSAREWLVVGAPSLAFCYGGLWVSGYLKKDRGVPTAYTRKIFHFLIFMSAAAVHGAGGLPRLLVFGTAASLVIFYAVCRGDGNRLYEAMARERDAPRRRYYILTPYFATLAGGLASTLLFGRSAMFGFLVAGVGDAIGEPVGERWGRLRYSVPFSPGATRSLEGSIAVGVASGLATLLCSSMVPEFGLEARNVVWCLALAPACALIEAVSPHGLDNFTMQVVPSGLAHFLLA